MTQLVLAAIVEGRPIPAGVTVLAHVRATRCDTVRHAIDATAFLSQHESMLLTILETADELRVSRRQVERLLKEGALPCVVIGMARRVDREDLVAFVAEHRQTGVRMDDTDTEDEAEKGGGGPGPPAASGPRGPVAAGGRNPNIPGEA